MGIFKTWRRFRGAERPRRRWGRWILGIVVAYSLLSLVIRALVPAPSAVAMAGMQYSATSMQFLRDSSWLDPQGNRQLSQELFDEIFQMIGDAQELILLDMFLFNAWQGPVPERHRALAAEMTNALIEQKRRHEAIQIIVISDPINTVYGGLESVHFTQLQAAGIPVVLTDLSRLQDSNPTWSGFWRYLLQPFGNGPGDLLPNPFGEGRVSLRSYLALLNFKANHRKLLVSDQNGKNLRGLVASANPHDGSSAHRNVALSFAGPAVLDLINAERQLLAMNEASQAIQRLDTALARLLVDQKDSSLSQADELPVEKPALHVPLVQVLSESKIHEAALSALDRAAAGDAVNLAMFYLSERKIIRALTNAVARGVAVRVLLDINNDAFGRQKNGVPNRPVAAELAAAGVDVRWCATSGEQCHSKWLHVAYKDAAASEHVFLLGSANFTRRNLLDLNLETNVQVRTVAEEVIAIEMIGFFEEQWNNPQGRTYSYPYEDYANNSVWLKLQYRFMEFSGLSTF